MLTIRNDYIKQMVSNDYINPDDYGRYDVKRGLRNADGTGVLVGLTRVGDVHGYEIKDGKKAAVPGKLFYRGVDVEEIISAAVKNKRFAFEETVYLLMFGQLPTWEQLNSFNSLLGSLRSLPRNFIEDSILKFPSRDIPTLQACSLCPWKETSELNLR